MHQSKSRIRDRRASTFISHFCNNTWRPPRGTDIKAFIPGAGAGRGELRGKWEAIPVGPHCGARWDGARRSGRSGTPTRIRSVLQGRRWNGGQMEGYTFILTVWHLSRSGVESPLLRTDKSHSCFGYQGKMGVYFGQCNGKYQWPEVMESSRRALSFGMPIDILEK